MSKNSTANLNQNSFPVWPLYPQTVRKVIVGRGLMLDLETFEATLRILEDKLTPTHLDCYKCILELRKGLLSNPTKEIRKVFGYHWKTCVIPTVADDTLLSMRDQGDERLLLRKGSRIFENECSFLLGAVKIFSPGVFPATEIDLYGMIGDTVLNLCSICDNDLIFCEIL